MSRCPKLVLKKLLNFFLVFGRKTHFFSEGETRKRRFPQVIWLEKNLRLVRQWLVFGNEAEKLSEEFQKEFCEVSHRGVCHEAKRDVADSLSKNLAKHVLEWVSKTMPSDESIQELPGSGGVVGGGVR